MIQKTSFLLGPFQKLAKRASQESDPQEGTKDRERKTRRQGRPILKGLVEHVTPTAGGLLKIGWILIGVSLFSVSATAMVDRAPNAMAYPYADEEEDYDDMLEEYQVYLSFVVAVGRSVDSRKTRSLVRKFQLLKNRDEKEAAKFLKGLRYEMDHRRQLTRSSRRSLHSRNRSVRAWVKRYIDDWEKEVDEYLYRAYVKQIIARSEED